MPDEDLIELKFRLYDGTDIGPIRYSASSTVAMLKERIISEWPRGRSSRFFWSLVLKSAMTQSFSVLAFAADKKIIPKVANDVKLISAGKVLENNTTIAQCRSPFGELPSGVVTMHVVVQPSLTKTKTGKLDLKTS
ncbi:hypothetical protein BHE74_00038149 [Ensete ventricosum]|nr:hypothetical protein GW17_00029108 [Ensete ventricosum]RWW55261.1 hypothetical protein BHE74_00038149 [Ensete ventricosum]RZR85080.1 hypothetical protein BHM03_00012032 [Ensete ventricosum]